MLRFGLPTYSTFNPWFYNTRMYDKVPITSWWDIVEGYNEDTQSFKDASGKNTQYWTIFSKDITAPSYAALWAQLISDSDKMAEQYKKQYGKDLVYTYQSHLKNTPGMMELPENNAGVELFWRFSQMTITPLADGDAVVEAVHDSVNGPTLGLCSASKLDNSKQSQGEGGMDIAWVTGLEPYTAQDAAAYSYVVSGCDNPAGARLYIKFLMGGDDGKSGCYTVFDKLGHWSVRDDVEYTKSGITYEEVNLTAPNFAQIYANYPNVKAYWNLWNSTR
jgi:iron(III) transport system substrate-binding protein